MAPILPAGCRTVSQSAPSPSAPRPQSPQNAAATVATAGTAELRVRSLLTAAPGERWQLHPVTVHAWRHHDSVPGRAEQLRHTVMRTLYGPRGAATLGSGKETRMTAPSESERMAAFDVQVELVTRIGVQELAPDSGSLREALASLHALFEFTRGTLRQYSITLAEHPAAPGTPTVHTLADELLNHTLRPFTSRWHPRLLAHEARRPEGVSPVDHERAWPQAAAMREDLAALRDPLLRIAGELAEISGADFGLATAG